MGTMTEPGRADPIAAAGPFPDREALYAGGIAAFKGAIERLARGYQPDADLRRDLVQEIHVALWRSLAAFDGRCSLRTWVFRVAHNTATSIVLRAGARMPRLVGIEDLEGVAAAGGDPERAASERMALERLFALIARLRPVDRQVILLYLEGEEAAAIAEVTGLSAGNVATRVHRLKRLLARQFSAGEKGDE
jgi:RNA polymerase sigma-70 factor (ECF subfamily)